MTINLDVPPGISADEAKLYLALKLYELHKVSFGFAANMAGYTLIEFVKIVNQFGIPVLDNEPADLQREMQM